MPGGAASSRKGARYVRECINAFVDAGWGAMAAPASGSATERDLPDLVAGRQVFAVTATKLYAIEHKCGDATTLYVDADEVDALEAFCERFGATPLLGARFTTQTTGKEHYLVRPEDARQTDDGNYGIPVSDAADRATLIVEPVAGVRRAGGRDE